MKENYLINPTIERTYKIERKLEQYAKGEIIVESVMQGVRKIPQRLFREKVKITIN